MRISYNAPFILTLGFICTLVLFLDSLFFSNQWLTHQFFTLYGFSFFNPLDYFRLISNVIGHSGWGHLFSNFSFILLLGPILEEKYGTKMLLIMSVLTALVTGILQVIFFNTGLHGASGLVFMLIVLSSITNFRKGEIPLTFILVAALFVGKEVYKSFEQNNISEFAHVLGGICGGFFGYYLKK